MKCSAEMNSACAKLLACGKQLQPREPARKCVTAGSDNLRMCSNPGHPCPSLAVVRRSRTSEWDICAHARTRCEAGASGGFESPLGHQNKCRDFVAALVLGSAPSDKVDLNFIHNALIFPLFYIIIQTSRLMQDYLLPSDCL